MGVRAVWGPVQLRVLQPPRAALELLTVRSRPATAAGDSRLVHRVQTQARPELPARDLTASQAGGWLERRLAALTQRSSGLWVLGAVAQVMLAVVVADLVSPLHSQGEGGQGRVLQVLKGSM